MVLDVVDFDPSCMYMSQCDLPQRIADYGGKHVHLDRVALMSDQTEGLPLGEIPGSRRLTSLINSLKNSEAVSYNHGEAAPVARSLIIFNNDCLTASGL